MKKLTLQEKQHTADALLRRINALHKPGETVRLMEVCGTHTVSIFREGLRQLLPSGIELVSGPGCPVCVTDQTYMDKALAYAERSKSVLPCKIIKQTIFVVYPSCRAGFHFPYNIR